MKNEVKNIQAAAYNGTHTVDTNFWTKERCTLAPLAEALWGQHWQNIWTGLYKIILCSESDHYPHLCILLSEIKEPLTECESCVTAFPDCRHKIDIIEYFSRGL